MSTDIIRSWLESESKKVNAFKRNYGNKVRRGYSETGSPIH